MNSPNGSPPKSPRKTVQEIEQEAQENLQKADKKKALEYVETHSLRKKEGEQWVKYPLNCDINEFGAYGIGLLLYFNFIKKMAIIFAILSIISIPSLVSNCIGDGLSASSSQILVTTLGNQPKLKVIVPYGVNLSNLTAGSTEYAELISANMQEMQNYNDLVNRNILMVALPDLFYSIIFFIFIIYLRINSRVLIETFSQHNVIISDFAAEVTGFPDTVVDPGELATHFEQFGGVVEVCLARNYHNTLMYNKKQADAENKIIIEQKRIEYDSNRSTKKMIKLKRKRNFYINEIEKKLNKYNLSGKKHDEYPSLKAYVLFDDLNVSFKTIEDYKHYWRYSFTRIFCNCLWDIKKIMPENFQFQGKYPLQLAKPTAPSDILWENLDASKGESFLRKLGSAIIVFFLMLITFIIIFAAQTQATPSTTECGTYISKASLQGADSTVIDCYCSQFSTSDVFIDSSLRSDCWDYSLKIVGFQLISIASSFIIVLVNFMLKWVLIKLGKFERYPTLTEETLSSMMKVFAAMFFNTAGITLLISARFGGTSGDNNGIVIAREIGKIIPAIGDYIELNKDQYPNDLDRLWYTNVGSKVIYTWLINIVSPHVVYFSLTPIIAWIRRRNARKSFIQRDMNLFSVGPNFEMIPKYALALNTIFVTLFYCSGMPILLFLGTASLFFQYWVEKYLLLRFYARPPHYNHDINTITLRVIPIALLLHLAIGVYTYGSEDIFMKQIQFPDFLKDTTNAQFSSSVTDFNGLIQERIKKVVYCFIALLLLAAFYLLDISFFRIISKVFKTILRKKQVRASTETTKTRFYENQEELKQQGLITYEIRGNALYRDLVHSIDTKGVKSLTVVMKPKANNDELIKLTEVECANNNQMGNSSRK